MISNHGHRLAIGGVPYFKEPMIPKIIHQTLPCKHCIQPAFVKNAEKLRKLNPGWQYRLYDDYDVVEFIRVCYPDVMPIYESINPEYGPARADLFRYLLMSHFGGVYLDIKSTMNKPLDKVLLPNDEYLLSFWNQQRNPGAGFFEELHNQPEYQQWHIITAPRHPFLDEVIASVIRNILAYSPYMGVGKMGVLRLTGPIAYTKAIQNIKASHKHRFVDITTLGFDYTMFQDCMVHNSSYGRTHYSLLNSPIVRH